MENEKLKAEAIRKAWIAEIGEEKTKTLLEDMLEHGFVVHSYLTEFFTMEQLFEMFDFKGKESDLFRPKSLIGIEDNNGWIRIEPDGSNLPTDENETYEVFTKEDMEKAQRENDALDVLYYFENGVISHYKPVVKSQPPIY